MRRRLRIVPDSAALERLRAWEAEADGPLALRARIVLARASGASLRETALRLRTTLATAQRWTRRFVEAGPDGLLGAAPRGRPPRRRADSAPNPGEAPHPPLPRGRAPSVPAPPAALPPHRRGDPPPGPSRPVSGPPPRIQERIAAFVRGRIAAGLSAPGARLPPRTWFAGRFGTTVSTVQKALERLAAEGFVEMREGRPARVSARLPFAGRYLFVQQYLEYGEGAFGLDRSLAEARRRLEAARAVRFDIVRPEPGADGEAQRETVRAAVASARYAGVFLRTVAADGSLPFDFLTRMDGVPVGGFFERGAGAELGSLATRFADAPEQDRDPYLLLRTLLAECQATGARRVSVLDYRIDPRRERDGPRLAANLGLSLHPLHHLRLSLSDFRWNRKVLDMVYRLRDLAPPEAYVVCNDTLAAMLCDFLVKRFGAERARRIPVAAAGNRPVLPPTPLPVVWHGLDCEATLAAFLDWADACHAGGPRPPDPARVWF